MRLGGNREEAPSRELWHIPKLGVLLRSRPDTLSNQVLHSPERIGGILIKFGFFVKGVGAGNSSPNITSFRPFRPYLERLDYFPLSLEFHELLLLL